MQPSRSRCYHSETLVPLICILVKKHEHPTKYMAVVFGTGWPPEYPVNSGHTGRNVFCGTLQSFIGTNGPRMPLRPGPRHPRPGGHYSLEFMGPSQFQRPPFYTFSGVMLLKENTDQCYQVPGVVPLSLWWLHTLIKDLGLVVRGIGPAIK